LGPGCPERRVAPLGHTGVGFSTLGLTAGRAASPFLRGGIAEQPACARVAECTLCKNVQFMPFLGCGCRGLQMSVATIVRLGKEELGTTHRFVVQKLVCGSCHTWARSKRPLPTLQARWAVAVQRRKVVSRHLRIRSSCKRHSPGSSPSPSAVWLFGMAQVNMHVSML
jgi:hypothetical protein